ncbi:uncharacterized protein LAESUDRAFT_761927 [Laetiporus sulphureus 93-53]|uniref:Uncharacterized protein n=1 Tax=Laetiporus sulphureus 93-53 TaxID=1314785 RepID=A0A165CS58_9APHY|nr:uncharacterized protein LAESUDRAFT_761927 [Laetiporus sulphureus 93-53]KZT03343.1 hypothetical protein LAESUDRAFT_761927 [Laetiporus sulphureus 93-53]
MLGVVHPSLLALRSDQPPARVCFTTMASEPAAFFVRRHRLPRAQHDELITQACPICRPLSHPITTAHERANAYKRWQLGDGDTAGGRQMEWILWEGYHRPAHGPAFRGSPFFSHLTQRPAARPRGLHRYGMRIAPRSAFTATIFPAHNAMRRLCILAPSAAHYLAGSAQLTSASTHAGDGGPVAATPQEEGRWKDIVGGVSR